MRGPQESRIRVPCASCASLRQPSAATQTHRVALEQECGGGETSGSLGEAALPAELKSTVPPRPNPRAFRSESARNGANRGAAWVGRVREPPDGDAADCPGCKAPGAALYSCTRRPPATPQTGRDAAAPSGPSRDADSSSGTGAGIRRQTARQPRRGYPTSRAEPPCPRGPPPSLPFRVREERGEPRRGLGRASPRAPRRRCGRLPRMQGAGGGAVLLYAPSPGNAADGARCRVAVWPKPRRRLTERHRSRNAAANRPAASPRLPYPRS